MPLVDKLACYVVSGRSRSLNMMSFCRPDSDTRHLNDALMTCSRRGWRLMTSPAGLTTADDGWRQVQSPGAGEGGGSGGRRARSAAAAPASPAAHSIMRAEPLARGQWPRAVGDNRIGQPAGLPAPRAVPGVFGLLPWLTAVTGRQRGRLGQRYVTIHSAPSLLLLDIGGQWQAILSQQGHSSNNSSVT